MPDIYIILGTFILLMAALTYIIPAGQYDRKLTETARGMKNLVVAGTYKAVEQHPSSWLDIITAIPYGFERAAGVVVLTFLVGACMGLIKRAGIIDLGVQKLSRAVSTSEFLVAPALMLVLSLLAAFIGTPELSLAYLPVFLPLLEGNVNLGGKKDLMAKLGIDALPTFLVEGKVCAQPVSPIIDEPTFLIRAYPGDDNPVVARAYEASARKLGYPAVYRAELLARSSTALRDLTAQLGERVMALGKAFRDAETSLEKVHLACELNHFVSQELGGVTFMSEEVHHVMGGVGMIPGTCGCLSLFIPDAQLKRDVIPMLTEAEAGRFADVILGGIPEIMTNLAEACRLVEAGRSAPGNWHSSRTFLFQRCSAI